MWYEVLWRLALPFALARLWWRGIREPGYRRHIGERFGRHAPLPDAKPVIWIHAVSVGETRAAQPLIARLQQDFPQHQILLTAMTAAGRATSEAVYGDKVTRAWLPYDTASAVERFLDWCRPQFGVLMETELWPNLILRARARGVPVFLANARLSEKSARGYARLPTITARVLRALAGIAAQAPSDAERLIALGATNVAVTGNLKFDMTIPEAALEQARVLRAMFGAGRPLWVAGSTRDGEEALLLDAMALARASLPTDALLLIVPRHPQRFDDVARLLERRGVRYARRSDGMPLAADVAVVVGDSMGEMFAYYGAADVAFIGGSLLPLGGQNLIEPLAVGTPVVIGPSSYNFSEATREAVAHGVARQCADASAVLDAVAALLRDADARARMRAAARSLLEAHRGATERTARWIEDQLRSMR